MDAATARFGSIDVLVNNAAINIDKPLRDLTEPDWDAVIDTNLKSVFLCSQRAAAVMLEQPTGGVIVNIGASTGIQGRKNGANYCAAKAGVLVLTQCLALELAPTIRVNCVIPGSTADSGRARRPEEIADKQAAIPLGRLACADEIAAAVTFIVSDQAGYITGQKLVVDGGQFMC
jgi:acetoacetyl-CoA reductase/3-oxoacyl-[acyl-carrier protein] reductase